MDISVIILSRESKVADKIIRNLSFAKEILVLKNPNIIDFAKARNYALKKSKGDWNLFVDDDEIVTRQLANEIKKAISKTGVNGYFINRKDYLFGKELNHGEFSNWGFFGNAKLIRLARKNKGQWRRPVHEYWDVKGKLESLNSPLLHYPHKNLKSFIDHINQYSDLHAKALAKEKKYSSIVKIVIWPVGKFIYNFIFRLGFMDGMEGFVAAVIMSFHSFLSWSKLYLWQKNSR